jgi:CO/xanthine dehydrogenase FAD-binding subunit
VGAIQILPFRLGPVEEALAGKVLNEGNIAAAIAKGADLIKPIPDVRTTPEYRKQLCEVLLRRTLEECERRRTGD